MLVVGWCVLLWCLASDQLRYSYTPIPIVWIGETKRHLNVYWFWIRPADYLYSSIHCSDNRVDLIVSCLLSEFWCWTVLYIFIDSNHDTSLFMRLIEHKWFDGNQSRHDEFIVLTECARVMELYQVIGANHIASYLDFEQLMDDGRWSLQYQYHNLIKISFHSEDGWDTKEKYESIGPHSILFPSASSTLHQNGCLCFRKNPEPKKSVFSSLLFHFCIISPFSSLF